MQLGMIGLGRMGASMVRRLTQGGHACVVYDVHAEAVKTLSTRAPSARHRSRISPPSWRTPRAIWLMVPAAVVDQELTKLAPLLEAGDIVIDGGNSYYRDDIRRGAELEAARHPLRGCRDERRRRRARAWLLPDDRRRAGHGLSTSPRSSPTLAPGVEAAPRTPGRRKRAGTAEQGYLHCGPQGPATS